MRKKQTTAADIGQTIIPKEKIDFIKSVIHKIEDTNAHIIEVGVYKGGSAKIIADNIDISTNLYLFDTFCGIPNGSEFDNHHITGDFYDIEYNDILEIFHEYPNVIINQGIFPSDTGYIIEKKIFKLVHLDVDSYLSYKESLEFIYDKVIKNGYIIFDDYNEISCVGATLAINEFFSDKTEIILKENTKLTK